MRCSPRRCSRGASSLRPRSRLRIVGRRLFEALFTGRVFGAYRASLGTAPRRRKRLGVVLRIVGPGLAALPWEALFDPETEDYLCRSEPLIRHVDAPYTAEPLEVAPRCGSSA